MSRRGRCRRRMSNSSTSPPCPAQRRLQPVNRPADPCVKVRTDAARAAAAGSRPGRRGRARPRAPHRWSWPSIANQPQLIAPPRSSPVRCNSRTACTRSSAIAALSTGIGHALHRLDERCDCRCSRRIGRPAAWNLTWPLTVARRTSASGAFRASCRRRGTCGRRTAGTGRSCGPSA